MPRLLLLCLLCLCWALPAQALEDHFQRTLTFPKRPLRIVSLSPANTELLYALGLEKQIVAVTSDCNYPPQATSKPQLGPFGTLPLEKILKLKPDLLVGTHEMGKALLPLKRLSIPLLTVASPSVEAIGDNLLVLGQATGRLKAAQVLRAGFFKRLKALSVPPSHTGFYLLWHQPLITASSHSFVGDVLRYSGVRNVVQSRNLFPHYKAETLLRQNPSVIIVPESIYPKIQWQRPPYERLYAVQNQRLIQMNDDLISRPSLRILEAIVDLKHKLAQLSQ